MDPETQKLFDTLGAQTQRTAETLAAVTGTGTDDDDLVSATCGPGNKLLDIEFDPRARRLDTHDLKEKVLSAVQRAAEASEREVNRIIDEQASMVTDVKVPGIDELRQHMAAAQTQLEEQKRRMEELASRFQGR